MATSYEPPTKGKMPMRTRQTSYQMYSSAGGKDEYAEGVDSTPEYNPGGDAGIRQVPDATAVRKRR